MKDNTHLATNSIFNTALSEHGWDALEFSEDTLTVKLNLGVLRDSVPDDVINALQHSDEFLIDPNVEYHRQTVVAEFTPALVTRELTQDELNALFEGYRAYHKNADHTLSDYNEIETQLFNYGFREAKKNDSNERQETLTDPEQSLAGRVPHPTLYKKNVRQGPNMFGFTMDFTLETDYTPNDTAHIIENGDFAESDENDFPEIDVFHPDKGTRYSFAFWPN